MKMKNKKAMSDTLATVLIVILIITSMAIISSLISQIFEDPHFKIIKEECGVRTVFDILTTNCTSVQMDGGWILKCSEPPLTYKNECKDVEVEEFPFIKNKNNIEKDKPTLIWLAGCIRSSNCLLVAEEDLTMGWLDENCDCIKCMESKGSDIGFQGIRVGDKILSCTFGCQKFKCGDYQVETWGQFK